METEPEPGGAYEGISEEQLLSAARHFTGDIQQVPPVFSAVKVDGKRAYQFARADKELELAAKNIHIETFELTRIALPEVDFRVVCGKGTYIRALARDFGDYLGCGAYLSALRRTRIGNFRVQDAQSVDDFLYISKFAPSERSERATPNRE